MLSASLFLWDIMQKNMIKIPLKRLLICTLIWMICGCFNPFAPKLDNSAGEDIVLTEQQTPDDVLENFIYAYTFKDSLVYADLLDSSFVFVYFDPDLGGSVVSYLGAAMLILRQQDNYLRISIPLHSPGTLLSTKMYKKQQQSYQKHCS